MKLVRFIWKGFKRVENKRTLALTHAASQSCKVFHFSVTFLILFICRKFTLGPQSYHIVDDVTGFTPLIVSWIVKWAADCMLSGDEMTTGVHEFKYNIRVPLIYQLTETNGNSNLHKSRLPPHSRPAALSCSVLLCPPSSSFRSRGCRPSRPQPSEAQVITSGILTTFSSWVALRKELSAWLEIDQLCDAAYRVKQRMWPSSWFIALSKE